MVRVGLGLHVGLIAAEESRGHFRVGLGAGIAFPWRVILPVLRTDVAHGEASRKGSGAGEVAEYAADLQWRSLGN
jgi:hypothetical protein